jgi:hypothetical protein
MKTAPSPKQGESLCWDLICVADELDRINQDQYFLISLYKIACSDPSLMDDDLLHLLTTYLDTNPREKLRGASENPMTISRMAKKILEPVQNTKPNPSLF